MIEPRGQELVKRYKESYGIPIDCVITEEMILKHWELEKHLRTELLTSTSNNRWEVFERCYGKLYSQLDWLTQFIHTNRDDPPSILYRNWFDIIGPPPMKIYEIGSGRGEFIHELATRGFECKATEITRERGERWVPPHPNLSWGISDGIHLDQFEPTGFYDLVISNNVIEHIHPDDLFDHFKGVFSILSNGGRYIISTPHTSLGPEDVTRVFKHKTPMGMHLKEYTYSEITYLLKQASFKHIYSVLRCPIKIRKQLGWRLKPKVSSFYLAYLNFLEKPIAKIYPQQLRRKVAKLLKIILFPPSIMVVAKKLEFR